MAEKTEEQIAAEKAAADKAAADKAAAEAAKKAKTVKARVLVDTAEHKVNDVIQVPENSRASWFDTNADAVAYAESLKG